MADMFIYRVYSVQVEGGVGEDDRGDGGGLHEVLPGGEGG